MAESLRIHLSLVSHTNIGKTTLARTLLARDVGEVADRAHVTESADDYVLEKTENGDELILWDTPGFGNSVALAKRLEGRSNPIGWFVGEVWDRAVNRTLWLDQQAMKHVREITDVVLYLVNAAEMPDSVPYVAAEMRILGWIGKPAVVLLNQMGEPRRPEEEAADIARWKKAMQSYGIVKAVIAMDAFARCWVQEGTLFREIGKTLPAEKQKVFSAFEARWKEKREEQFSRSMKALSAYLESIGKDREPAESPSIFGQLETAGTLIGKKLGLLKKDPEDKTDGKAQQKLSERAAEAFAELTDELLSVNGLTGKAAKEEILSRVKTGWDVHKEVPADGAAIAGAVGSGAVGGLAADLASGGLTLGMGALIGAVIGALGGAGAALAYNRQKAPEGTFVTWSEEAKQEFAVQAVLLYLAVAHYGRGRGEWKQGESPAFWLSEAEKAAEEGKSAADFPANAVKAVLRKLYPESGF